MSAGGTKIGHGTYYNAIAEAGTSSEVPVSGCGVPPSYYAEKGIPFCALNTNSMYEGGANCGRFVEITVGKACGGGHGQYSVCDEGGAPLLLFLVYLLIVFVSLIFFEGVECSIQGLLGVAIPASGAAAACFVASLPVPWQAKQPIKPHTLRLCVVWNSDDLTGKKFYCYISDQCPDDNYWCKMDDNHIDISRCAAPLTLLHLLFKCFPRLHVRQCCCTAVRNACTAPVHAAHCYLSSKHRAGQLFSAHSAVQGHDARAWPDR